eukprot:PhF_6_TR35441/c0_g1_i1/m.51681
MSSPTPVAPSDLLHRLTAYQQHKNSFLSVDDSMHQLMTSRDFLDTFAAWLQGLTHQYDSKFNSALQHMHVLRQNVCVNTVDYWSSHMLVKHCSLTLDQPRLTKGARRDIDLGDALKLMTTFHNVKTSKLMTAAQAQFVDGIEGQLKDVSLDAREIRILENALEAKLSDDVTRHNSRLDIDRYQQTIKEIMPDIETCEQLLDAATLNGDMALAEEIAQNQLLIYERLVALSSEQYPILKQKEYDFADQARRRRWQIFRLANGDVGRVVSERQRLVEACRDDERKIHQQITSYTQDNINQTKRYHFDIAESDRFLEENKKAQQTLFNRLHEMVQEFEECHSEMSRLSQLRKQETQRRLDVEEREAGRRAMHDSFLNVAAEHIRSLQELAHRAEHAISLCKAVESFILEGTESLAKRHDERHDYMKDLMQGVQKQTMRHFTDYYLAMGRLRYRRLQKKRSLEERLRSIHMKLELACETYDPQAKKHALDANEAKQHLRVAEEQVTEITKRMNKAKHYFEPVLTSLREYGIDLPHPDDILEKINYERTERMLDYREAVITDDSVPNDELKYIEEQRTELKSAQMKRTAAKQDEKTKSIVRVPQPPATNATTRNSNVRALERYNTLCKDIDTKKDNVAAAINVNRMSFSGDVGVEASQTTPNYTSSLLKHAQQQRTSEARAPKTTAVRGTMEGKTVVALYGYKPKDNGDELSFGKGDRIVCIGATGEDGWYYGICNQRAGVFPGNYVTVVDE